MLCPVCSSYDTEIMSDLEIEQFSEVMYKCKSCNSVFTHTRETVIVVKDSQEDSFMGHCKDCVDGDCECIEN